MKLKSMAVVAMLALGTCHGIAQAQEVVRLGNLNPAAQSWLA